MIAGPVVIGVDYSPAIDRASDWIRTLTPGAAITVVRVVERAEIPAHMHRLVGEPEYSAREAEADAVRLREWADAHGLQTARTVVRQGRPDDVLRDTARQINADLIVVGAHQGDERPWRRLGTVPERLLRSATASLLVVHPGVTAIPRRVLVAVDDAAITTRVLQIAGRIADRFDAALTAVHVISTAAYSHALSMIAAENANDPTNRAGIEDEVAAEAQRWLRALSKATRGHEPVAVEVPHGDAAGEILGAAERLGADLIVAGRCGAGRVVPALLGSVVGSVVQHAHCPVLVVADAPPSGRP